MTRSTVPSLKVDCPEDVASYIHRVGRTARYVSSEPLPNLLCLSLSLQLKQSHVACPCPLPLCVCPKGLSGLSRIIKQADS